MSFWPYVSAALAAGVAVLGGRQLRKRARKLELAQERARRLETLAKEGVVFSRRYDFGSSTLIIDEPSLQWVLIDHGAPLLARARPFTAIAATYCIRDCKLHAGVRRVNEAAMLRSGTGKLNREYYQTDIARGLEIRLKAPEEEKRLYIDCMDAELSPEWLQAIFDNFMEIQKGE